MRILAISFALLNLLLWYSVPAIRSFVDAQTGRWANPNNPSIMTGVQELLVYFDPWLARSVFPVVFTLGFALIPFLRKPDDTRSVAYWNQGFNVVITLLLIGFEMVWLSLIAVGVFLRGPNWNIFWPGEEWSEHKIVALNNVDLSQYVWARRGISTTGMSSVYREFLGLLLLSGYWLAGISLAYGCYRLACRTTPYWRWAILTFLLQLAALVPLKIACRWLFNIKYWISFPDVFWNI
jgi:hypothetical protein